MDPDELRDSIYTFLQREGEERSRNEVFDLLEGPRAKKHPNLGALYVFDGSLGEFWVSGRGNVVTYNAPDRMSVQEAQEYVKECLDRHVESFNDRNYELKDSNFSDPIWMEEWKEKPAEDEVSIFENWATVQVNVETHKLHYFNRSDLRRVRTTEPSIAEETARKEILKRNPEHEIDRLRLTEHTADGGKTWRTIWYAVLQPEDVEAPQKPYSLDADTGEVVE